MSSKRRRRGAKKKEAPRPDRVTVFTDGACNPNPGPGGWAALIQYGEHHRAQKLSGGEPDATDNRMELRAAIEALRAITTSELPIDIHTDSTYLRRGITEWLTIWLRNGWQTVDRSAVKNRDLWEELAQLLANRQVSWHWVPGHAGNRRNEMVDRLARAAIPRPKPIDAGNAIHVHTAAVFLSKTNCGGWGSVLRFGEHRKTLSGTEPASSANRMHLLAAIEGLEALKKALPVIIHTSSSYVRDGATRWIASWKLREWTSQEGEPVKHRDLWERLAGLLTRYQVTWEVESSDLASEEALAAKELARTAVNPVAPVPEKSA